MQHPKQCTNKGNRAWHITCVWGQAAELCRSHSLNTIYSLTFGAIIWMIYVISFAVSLSSASWWHMAETLIFCLAFRRRRAVIKNSVFCQLPLNVCQRFYCVTFQLKATEWICFSLGVFPQEKSVALRKEGSGVILDCQLPHLIGINEDLLTTGIILYYLNVNRFHFFFFFF